jgi:predicted amidohydrolase YtcJ
MTDGVLENYTGSLLAPYCDGCGGSADNTDNTGLQFIEPELLDTALDRLTGLGFQVHMHTIGDRAVRLALDAVEKARAIHGPHDLRHHLAHIQIVHPDDLARFRALDVVANCQTLWAQSDPQMDELTVPFLGQDRVDQMYPFGSLLRRGAVLAMGSDWPVTSADPLQQMEVAVRRIGHGTRDAEPFLPHEALPLSAALAAFTSGSAYVNHDDHDAGTLEAGRRADLAVLDRDLFSIPDGCVADAQVVMTVAHGQVVHDTL